MFDKNVPSLSYELHKTTDELSKAPVHNLRPYGRMRPSITRFAAVHMKF